MASKLVQAQFRMLETGATSKSLGEIELRNIIIPYIRPDDIQTIKNLINLKVDERNNIVDTISSERKDLYNNFINAIKEKVNKN